MNPKSGQIVLVYINLAMEPQNVAWTLKKSSFTLPRQFTPWETSTGEDLKEHPAINIADGFEIPPRSIVTFVGN
jgi:hypothetical protein